MFNMKNNKEKKELKNNGQTPDKGKDTLQEQTNQEPLKQEEPEIDETAKLKSEIEKLKDTLLRKVAEFENYKRRTDAEISNYLKYASEKIIKELLPVYDDMIRSKESIEKGETKDFETLKTGFISISDKFRAIMEKEGLKEIDVTGKQFDVETCDALMQIPNPDVEPNTVLEVVEKGYYLKDKIIRHAKVLVSSEVPEPEKNNEEGK